MANGAADGGAAPDRVHRTIEAVFRLESPRLIAGLARLMHDVGLAEELAQDAMVAALEQWPGQGVPANPGAWLMAVGRRRGIDVIRRSRNHDAKIAQLGRERQAGGDVTGPDPAAAPEVRIEDDLLRLIVAACHPALTPDAQVTMILRLLAGLSTAEIARALLMSESAVAQRISRAKKSLRAAGVTFEAPTGDEVAGRLPVALRVIYLLFNEGYTATRGRDWTRPDLCHEALRLARLLQGLLPGEPEVHGLAALLELQASRLAARIGPGGEPVLLEDQNRAHWDPLLIRRGLDGLRRAEQFERARPGPRTMGFYGVQAAIAACHATAVTAAATDWARIAELYGLLAAMAPSPVVELNRTVAISRADGPRAGLDALAPLLSDPALRGYHLLPAVHADLLARLGRHREAAVEFGRAAGMAGNDAERALLDARAMEQQEAGVSAGTRRSDS